MKRRNRSRLTGKGKRPRKALPGQLSRVVQPGPGDGQARYTSFSRTDRAPQLHLDDSLLVLEGEKGYRMARTTHGVQEGCWFCEMEVLTEQEDGHSRLGWATKQADLQTPVGFDAHGFAYRDIEGVKVHSSVREPYGEPYGKGDVVGLLIQLPALPHLDSIHLDHVQAVARGGAGSPHTAALRNGAANGATATDTSAAAAATAGEGATPGVVRFFKNGADQGVAFHVPSEKGPYYAAASLYRSGRVRLNCGPEFAFPPPPEFAASPLSALCTPPPHAAGGAGEAGEGGTGVEEEVGGDGSAAAENGSGTGAEGEAALDGAVPQSTAASAAAGTQGQGSESLPAVAASPPQPAPNGGAAAS